MTKIRRHKPTKLNKITNLISSVDRMFLNALIKRLKFCIMLFLSHTILRVFLANQEQLISFQH